MDKDFRKDIEELLHEVSKFCPPELVYLLDKYFKILLEKDDSLKFYKGTVKELLEDVEEIPAEVVITPEPKIYNGDYGSSI